jgi:putative membrane protein
MMPRHILIASSALLALTLSACGPKAENTVDAAANSASETADAAGAMASNAMVDVEQALTATPNGQEFANKAAKTDAYEIAAAKLAQTNAASAEVKAFAAEMIKAHTDSTAKIKAAAAKASPAIVPDAALTQDQNDELAELAKKKGAEFDEEYIDEQVDVHQTALAMMRDYSEKGDTPSLKAAAGEIAGVVQKHLDHAKSLDK